MSQIHVRSPSHACRQWSLATLCQHHIAPFCEGAQSPSADKKRADAENAVRAIAKALQLEIVVGTGQHAVTCGEQHSRNAWSMCQLHLMAKPGHFGIAWA